MSNEENDEVSVFVNDYTQIPISKELRKELNLLKVMYEEKSYDSLLRRLLEVNNDEVYR